MENTLTELKEYFGATGVEFRTFWLSLTNEEKEYYKTVDLGQ